MICFIRVARDSKNLELRQSNRGALAISHHFGLLMEDLEDTEVCSFGNILRTKHGSGLNRIRCLKKQFVVADRKSVV